MKLWTYLKTKMQNNPNQVICENNASMTFEQMMVFAEKFSKELKGVKCCAILCQSEMAASMALLSCFAAQVTALPLSQRYGEIHCNKILDFISPDAVITDQNGQLQILRLADSQYSPPKTKPALIMCTSGTTGTPKGVMLTEKNIITNTTDICLYFDINKTDSILISRSLYHCAVLTGEFLTSIIKGTKIHFYSGDFNPIYILKLLKEKEITAFCGTPTLLNLLTRLKGLSDVDKLKHICISGECMGAETAKRILQAFPISQIYHIYGLTEACPRVSYLPPEFFNEYPDCVGIPLPSVSVKILCDNGSEAKTNEVGLLWVKGENVMAGYYNNPEKTSQALQDGWLCTGDLALINEAGFLKIKGRNDDLIIKAGMNIYPQEIENALKTDSRVHEVCVFGEKNENFGTQIVLNIVGDFADLAEVKELCLSCLPQHQMPAKINLLEKLNKNGSGKIIRR